MTNDLWPTKPEYKAENIHVFDEEQNSNRKRGTFGIEKTINDLIRINKRKLLSTTIKVQRQNFCIKYRNGRASQIQTQEHFTKNYESYEEEIMHSSKIIVQVILIKNEIYESFKNNSY